MNDERPFLSQKKRKKRKMIIQKRTKKVVSTPLYRSNLGAEVHILPTPGSNPVLRDRAEVKVIVSSLKRHSHCPFAISYDLRSETLLSLLLLLLDLLLHALHNLGLL